MPAKISNGYYTYYASLMDPEDPKCPYKDAGGTTINEMHILPYELETHWMKTGQPC